MSAPADANRWIVDPYGNGITTNLRLLTKGEPHSDHIEMGGRAVNAIVRWSVTSGGRVSLDRLVRWPMLREKKDDTHAAFQRSIKDSDIPPLLINGAAYQPGRADEFSIEDGLIWIEADQDLFVTRKIFPSTGLPCLLESWEIINHSKQTIEVSVPRTAKEELLPKDLFATSAHRLRIEWIGGGKRSLAPGGVMHFGLCISARAEGDPAPYPDVIAEESAREEFSRGLFMSKLDLSTGDKEIDLMFRFSKLRAAENVLATRGGLMHAPGGFNRYLAALWCNDQNEYVSPFFPFLGDPAGNESARNAYLWFAKYMNSEFKPIPSSIVAEGRSFWNGAGDRGDAAMTAYGASRWALATGDPDQAREVWPFIKWCLEFCERKKTKDGVIASDSDELENRFSPGKTNLATSCLTYDALVSATYLAKELGEPQALVDKYMNDARNLKAAINSFFGAKAAGFDSYRYHEGLEKLRSWICIPLVMDIHERAEGTVKALFTPELWTEDGLLTEAGSTTYWDRSTLYALRGVFRAGYPDIALEKLKSYTQRRMLGDHVPYCQEAYPEQNQSHLSAESGLYCRIIIEGLFGIRPTGFSSFKINPQLPKAWNQVSLNSIHAFGREWGCTIKRLPTGEIDVTVTERGGRTVHRTVLPPGAERVVNFAP